MLNVAYAFLVRGGSAEDIEKLNYQLEAPARQVQEHRRLQIVQAGGEIG